MNWTRGELKDNANILLKNKGGKPAKVMFLTFLPGIILGLLYTIAITIFIFYAVMSSISNDFGSFMVVYFVVIFSMYPLIFAVTIFLTNILKVGAIRFFLNFRSGRENTDDVWYGFRNGNYGNIFKVCFLKTLFIFLWSLLFYVPGIIKYFEYSMVPFLLAEDPKMSAKEAFERSKMMMNGQKMDAFVLDLTFIGWFILSSYTYHILYIVYLGPYFNLTWCELYYKLSGRQMPRLMNPAPGPVYPAYPQQGYPAQPQGYPMPQAQMPPQGYPMPQAQMPPQGYPMPQAGPAEPPHPTTAEQSAVNEMPVYDPGVNI